MVIRLRGAPLIRSLNAARAYAMLILGVVLTPALILAGALAIHSARLERAQLEQTAKNQSREATAAIERETGAIQNVLFALSDSSLLRRDDLEGFFAQATDVARRLGVVIVLSDAQNVGQLVNTALPWGASLVESETPPLSAADQALLQSGNAVVTNVFLGKLSNKYKVAVVVPVLGDGHLRFNLSPAFRCKDLPIFWEVWTFAPIRSSVFSTVKAPLWRAHQGRTNTQASKRKSCRGKRKALPSASIATVSRSMGSTATPHCSGGLSPRACRTACWTRPCGGRSPALQPPAACSLLSRSDWLTRGAAGYPGRAECSASIAIRPAKSSRFYLIPLPMG